ncbi:CHAD domain-containing protein [Streptomyces beihaiensis]|uniref:CHAD domain-containing protein n=1 Tax=Streptomyces beihaiensis TaxID=2984495 RepID=A0ABT3U1P0_9ACTN|nr:CHAD domain-containing protein [Streptomyces beihaiensis]MCX3062170.1 CHAD domain-containing protein [Streptomyces beihaiensis]
MAQQHLESDVSSDEAGHVLAGYLRAQATEFLRSLRQHGESGAAGDTAGAARSLRRAARRVSGTLHTFRPLLDADWSDTLRPELAWLSGTLAQEHAYADRLERLHEALRRLTTATTATTAPPPQRTEREPRTSASASPSASASASAPAPASARSKPPGPASRETLTVGAAKATALLDRQLTLARTRAHSTALQALGSSRFHAVADSVAVLASEVPLSGADIPLAKLAAQAESRLTEAVVALHDAAGRTPCRTTPYDADTDAPWHHVRLLLRLHRYAQEVTDGRPAADGTWQADAARALDAHRDAAEAAAAAAQAARTARIAPSTAYALGVLHADQRHQVEAARAAFTRAWQREAVGTP